MTHDTQSLLTLLALILGAGVCTVAVLLALAEIWSKQ
jgi:hypothetical protein